MASFKPLSRQLTRQSTIDEEDAPDIDSFDYSGKFSEYFVEINEEEYNKDKERTFFNFYEQPDIQENIHSTISAYERGKKDLMEFNSGNKDEFFKESMLNHSTTFSFKIKNEIICTSKNILEEYINQTKIDWNRINSLRPLYSSKFNYFFGVNPENKEYITNKNNYKEYLTVVNGIYKYLLGERIMESHEEEDDYESIEVLPETQQLIMEDLNINNDVFKEISCKCSRAISSRREINHNCITFTRLEAEGMPSNVTNILYKLLPIFQSSDTFIVLGLVSCFNKNKDKYEKIEKSMMGVTILNFTYSDTYFYFDVERKTISTLFIVYLMVEIRGRPPFNIPIYKVIHVYPIETSEFSYVFFYIDNDPPSNVNAGSFFSGFNYYKFIEDKIRWYMAKPTTDFIGLSYDGADLKEYNRVQSMKHMEKHRKIMLSKFGGKKYRRHHKKRGKKTRKSGRKGRKGKKTYRKK